MELIRTNDASRLALDAGAGDPSCSLMSRGMIRVGPFACREAGNWTIGIWEIDPEAIGLAALEYSRYPLSWVREGSFSVALAMIETNGFVCRKAER